MRSRYMLNSFLTSFFFCISRYTGAHLLSGRGTVHRPPRHPQGTWETVQRLDQPPIPQTHVLCFYCNLQIYKIDHSYITAGQLFRSTPVDGYESGSSMKPFTPVQLSTTLPQHLRSRIIIARTPQIASIARELRGDRAKHHE